MIFMAITPKQLKLMIKVAKRRVAQGEKLDDILASWANLTEEEKEEIRKAVEG